MGGNGQRALAARGRGQAKVALSATAWSPDAELPVHEWLDHGRRLGTVGRAAGWWIGDWLNYGNERFGERYSRASRITGYDVQTLMNMVYVASRFEPERRRERLSFSHHAEVAALDPDEQDRWLAHAETERLSVRCLREELRRDRALPGRARALPVAEPEDEVVCPECGCRLERGDAEHPLRLASPADGA